MKFHITDAFGLKAGASPKLSNCPQRGLGRSTSRINKKLFMQIKLTAILVTAVLVQASAAGYSQKITLNEQNSPIEKVFQSIERQTDYVFFYDSKELDKINVTVKIKNARINEALGECFDRLDLIYKIIGNTIVVKKKAKNEVEIFGKGPVYLEVNEVKNDPPPLRVKGKVLNDRGEPVVSASVMLKGTQEGVVTDEHGIFSIEVPNENSILVFTSLGFISKELRVGVELEITVTLSPDLKSLEEVVVTAFGLEKQKKALTYTTQKVDTKELSKARELNVINSLSGKVAGLSINRSGSGLGSPSRVILRGNRSINGDSEPLYVIDGVPGDINSINPDDIESINVLKGPNAAALYGSRANNGAIVINTKTAKGSRGFRITLNNTYLVDIPILLTDYQNVFGQGNSGVYSKNAMASWGSKMDGSLVDHWSTDPNWPQTKYSLVPQPDNVKDFYQTGHQYASGITISGGNEKGQAYFSYNFTDATGVVPNNKLGRHNINLRLTNKLTDRFELDAKLNYIKDEIRNQLTQGFDETNPNFHALPWSRNVNTKDAEIFEYTDVNGLNRQHFWSPGYIPSNPYWVVNRNLRNNNNDFLNALTSLKYSFSKNLSLQIRSALTRSFGASTSKIYNESTRNLAIGQFTAGRTDAFEWNSDFLLSYSSRINSQWGMNLNIGGNSRKRRNSGLSSSTTQGLTVPNLFTLANSQRVNGSYSVGGPKNVNSVYGFGQLSFKNALFMDITARNDWSSTLPESNWSYFYPSVGFSAILSEFLTSMPSFLTFAKLRASYAEVGNDTDPYQLDRTASVSSGGRNGFLFQSAVLPNKDLKSERTKSIEVGADVRFFKNRLGIDFTYYKTNSLDQLFTVALPVGSGASSFFTNGGDVQNKGVEFVISATPIKRNDFIWEITLNYAKNKSLVKKINDERPTIIVGNDYIREFRIEQGKPWGEIYTRGFQRDDQGNVIVGTDGLPKITTGFNVHVGNYNPDWLGGIRNSITYKKFSFNFLIDVRKGGTITSITNAILAGYGVTSETLQGRDGGIIFGNNFYPNEPAVLEDGSKNNIPITAEMYWSKVGGQFTPVGETFTVSASNVRLREAVISYLWSSPWLSKLSVKSVDLSLVGRNLFFLSNKAGNIDPDVIVGTGKEAQGYDSFAPPTSRSFGLSLLIGF